MVQLEALAGSALFQRLRISSLKALVEEASQKAAALLSTVVHGMPLYTLHNERHILNVIGWMEALLGPEQIAKLSELECALAILAAYVHDLGMTLTPVERLTIHQDPAYQRHRARFTEESSLIDRLASQGPAESYRASLIENHIITDYIRVTHAGEPNGRMATRLKEITSRLEFQGIDLTFRLELLALSHNRGVDWLRLEFERLGFHWHTSVHRQRINFPFLAILLRLADILDFDSSRTPTILFRHFGLDQALADRFSQLSASEWKKHLAITDTPISKNGAELTYRAEACPDPVIHKSIFHFVDLIQDELRRCAFELRQCVEAVPEDRERLAIRLDKVAAEITPGSDVHGKRAYEYHDWSFSLDQDEILRLLMGETLYGDPNLCIRELLQNSLDALELRDLRLQLQDKGVNPFQPVDGTHTRKGFFKHRGPEEELATTISWGEHHGVQFIKVEDNGVGMSLPTIERFFTQIGKSFYKSPDFAAEQALFRTNHLISTPISQFGIGILSCFMIADRLSVRTNAADHKPIDLEISGPGSLFWTKPGTLSRQGTEINLWLRSAHRIPMQHDRELVFRWLRGAFKYLGGERSDDSLQRDPGFIAARHVVWPKYPVHVAPPDGLRWTINDRFHIEHLAPIDIESFNAKLGEWDYAQEPGNAPHWEIFDWEDTQRPNASGTRFRLWYPGQAKPGLESWRLAAFVAPQIEQMVPTLLAQSMFVSGTNAILECLPCVPEPGCRIWIDLRGALAPALTADRKTARSMTANSFAEVWQSLISSPGITRVLNHATWRTSLHNNYWTSYSGVVPGLGCLEILLKTNTALNASTFMQALARDFNFERALDGDPGLARDLTSASDLARELAIALALGRASNLANARALARELALDLALDLARASDLASDLARARDLASDLPSGPNWNFTIESNILQEGFFPNLRRSWPVLELQALDGKIGDAVLTSPAGFRFQLDGRRVLFADQAGRLPQELAGHGYDFCFPMSAIPIGPLRRDFPAWREDRRYRALAVLPFLYSELRDIWANHAGILQEIFAPIASLYALHPAQSLWFKPFAEWTRADWKHPDHESVLWDLRTGAVTTYPGIRERPTKPARKSSRSKKKPTPKGR